MPHIKRDNNSSRSKRQNKTSTLGARAGWIFLALGGILIAVGCNFAADALPSQPLTPTILAANVTYAPVITMTPNGPTPTNPTDALTATSSTSQEPGINSSSGKAAQVFPHYDLDAILDMRTHTASVKMQVVYTNTTGQALSQVVFHVDPNRSTNVFTLTDVTVESPLSVDKVTLTGPRLEINLKDPLPAGDKATFTMHFAVHIPTMTDARLTYLAYTDHEMNLGNWLPEIATFANGNWIVPKAWTVGEYTASEMGDYHAHVTIQNGDHFQVVGPGEATHPDQRTWDFDAPRLRTFTLCVSDGFDKVSATSRDGTQIDLYYFTKNIQDKLPDGTLITPAQHALDTAQKAVELYTDLFGPSGNKRIVLIEGDFPDGMEFSGLVFVSQLWFQTYNGNPDSWLTLITAHEVAHQWFYSLVSDDQAATPYMDETFAIYCEVLFLEKYYPTLPPWWWATRIKKYQPQGYVDSTVYEYGNLRLYINAVYLRGALMMQEIRDSIGEEAFFKWWHGYTVSYMDQIATAQDLWHSMTADDYAKTQEIRSRYMRQPDPLNPSSPTVTPLPPTHVPVTAQAATTKTH